MTVEARSLSDPSRSHPPRKLRNFLLEPRFQLKYSGMVVAVTVAVASVLGYNAYRYSRGQTELLNVERMERMERTGGSVDARFIADLDLYAREADRRVLIGVLSGIAMLALALGLTGIVVTHRVVGPAHRLKKLFRVAGQGRLQPPSGLRRHDELQDVFEAFSGMLSGLRGLREQELRLLDEALERANAGQLPEEAVGALRTLRERMQRSLD